MQLYYNEYITFWKTYFIEEEWINLETGEKSLMQREYYYDEKQNLLFTVEKNGDKITTYYYENYYDNDKLIYQMKYLIVE